MPKVLVTRIAPYDMERDGKRLTGLTVNFLDLTVKKNIERGTSEASHYKLKLTPEDSVFFKDGLGFYEADFDIVPGRELREGGQMMDVTFYMATFLAPFREFVSREEAIAQRRAELAKAKASSKPQA